MGDTRCKDLNPLYNVEENHQYKKKYYQQLMPLVNKYLQTLPWNDTITFESLKFFSPIVVWTKFHPNQKKEDVLWSAFMDYYLAWLNLMNEANPEDDANKILSNKEAQHKYLSWRATKDPGHSLLRKLVGDSYSKDLITEFLFNGVLTIGSRTFLDYFPEYKCADGSINKKRSVVGKSFPTRPWDRRGRFIGV
eukprot:TRINITY_DN1621_c0_g1_i1.p1 TRINITY_DN1621_c0_g1~~TRINITY_DN1621_c0_g1_i1.p1  ORF type:complete len:193 (-),score=30.68 TRINITY_DN1621_c0_g1_i1:221-799(-)